LRRFLALGALLIAGAVSAQIIIQSGPRPYRPTALAADTLTCISDAELAKIPWHSGSGDWGAQRAVECADLPTTTTTASCSTRAACNSAITSGVQLTITAGWAASSGGLSANGVSDIDIIINSGVLIGHIQFGDLGTCSPAQARIRVRGPTPGTFSGGTVGQLRFGNCVNHVTVDGIAVNGDSTYPTGGEAFQCFRPTGATTHYTLIQVRALCPAYFWLGDTDHLVLNGVAAQSGAASDSAITTAGYSLSTGSWALRNEGGQVTIVNSDIRTPKYVPVRLHSGTVGGATDELGAIIESRVVNLAESRAPWLFTDAQAGSDGPGMGAVVIDSDIYAFGDGDCTFASGFGVLIHTDYSNFDNVNWYEQGIVDFSQALLDSSQASATGTHIDSDNVFTSFTGTPSWLAASAGDPTGIAMAAGLTFSASGLDSGNCGAIP
jgi:hypothetical protein